MLTKSITTLMQAARGRVVLKYYGQLCLSLLGLTAVPLLLALGLAEWGYAWRFGLATAAMVAVGLPLGRLAAPGTVQVNEALSVTALTFLTAALAMAFCLGGEGMAPIDALFEGVSSVTTTGLSTLGSVEGRSAVFLFARAWGQWYGGLVIVVLALALVLRPGIASKRLSDLEGGEDPLGGTQSRARRILAVYALLTVAGTLAVWAIGPDFFTALVHVLAAVSTGGFSSRDASLAGLGTWPVQALVIVLSLAGAVSFALYLRAWRSGWRELAFDREFVAVVAAGLVSSVLLGATLGWAGRLPWPQVLLHAPLNAFSAQTTAGFATLDVAAFDPASKLVLMLSMFIGGDLGSTAGGIKILRLLVVLHLAYQAVVRTALPQHAVVPPRVAARQMSEQEIQSALTTVLWYLIVMLVSWLPFLVLGTNPFDALFEVVSALGTVGLSAGVSAPSLHPLLKAVLSLDMLLGRLEIVALLVLIYPGTWRGRRESSP